MYKKNQPKKIVLEIVNFVLKNFIKKKKKKKKKSRNTTKYHNIFTRTKLKYSTLCTVP